MLIFLQIEESSEPKYQILEAPCQCQDVSIAYNILKMSEQQKQTSNLIKGHRFTMFAFLFDSGNSVLEKKSIFKEKQLMNTNRTMSLNC